MLVVFFQFSLTRGVALWGPALMREHLLVSLALGVGGHNIVQSKLKFFPVWYRPSRQKPALVLFCLSGLILAFKRSLFSCRIIEPFHQD